MTPVGPQNLFLRWVLLCPAPTPLLFCPSSFLHSLLSSVLLRFHLTPPLCSAVASEEPCLCLGCLQIQFTTNQCREAWFYSHNIHFTLFISEAACIRSDKAWDMRHATYRIECKSRSTCYYINNFLPLFFFKSFYRFVIFLLGQTLVSIVVVPQNRCFFNLPTDS